MADGQGTYGTIVVVKKTGGAGASLPLDRCEDDDPNAIATRIIGSKEGVDIRVHMPSVEDHHAVVQLHVDHTTWIVNQSTENPVEWDGEKLPVGKPVQLMKEGELSFCGRKFQYRPPVPSAEASTSVPAAETPAVPHASPKRGSSTGVPSSPRQSSSSIPVPASNTQGEATPIDTTVPQSPVHGLHSLQTGSTPAKSVSTENPKSSLRASGGTPTKAASTSMPAAAEPVAAEDEIEMASKTVEKAEVIKTPTQKKQMKPTKPPVSVQVNREKVRPARRRSSSGRDGSPDTNSFKVIKMIGAKIDKSTHVGLTGVTLRDEHPAIASAVMEALEDTPANLLSPEHKEVLYTTIDKQLSVSKRVSPMKGKPKSPTKATDENAEESKSEDEQPRSESWKATPKGSAKRKHSEGGASTPSTAAKTSTPKVEQSAKKSRPTPKAASPAKATSPKPAAATPRATLPMKTVSPKAATVRLSSPKSESPARGRSTTPKVEATSPRKAKSASPIKSPHKLTSPKAHSPSPSANHSPSLSPSPSPSPTHKSPVKKSPIAKVATTVSPFRVATPEQRKVLQLRAREELRADPEFRAQLRQEILADVEAEWTGLYIAPLKAHIDELSTALTTAKDAIRHANESSAASLSAEVKERRTAEEEFLKKIAMLCSEVEAKEKALKAREDKAAEAQKEADNELQKQIAKAEEEEKAALAVLSKKEKEELEVSQMAEEAEKAEKNKRKSVGTSRGRGKKAVDADEEAELVADEREKKREKEEEEEEPAPKKKAAARKSLAPTSAKAGGRSGRSDIVSIEDDESEKPAPKPAAKKAAATKHAEKGEQKEKEEELPKKGKKAAAKRGRATKAVATMDDDTSKETTATAAPEPAPKKGKKPAAPVAKDTEAMLPKAPKTSKKKASAVSKHAMEEQDMKYEKDDEPGPKKRATRSRK